MGKNFYITRVVSTGWIHRLKLVYPPAARSQQPSFEGFAGRAHRARKARMSGQEAVSLGRKSTSYK